MTRISVLAACFTGLLVIAGCTPDTKSVENTGDGGDDTGAGGDDGGGDDGNSETVTATIADIQEGTYGDGSTVLLERVVVTSPFTQAGDGFFIQDSGGGPWSGIYVYAQGGTDDLFLSVGDEINITGVVSEFYDWTELTIASTAAVEVTGEAAIAIDVVDPSTTNDWEKWESCLISIGAANIESVNSYGEAMLDNGLILDDLLTDFNASSGGSYSNVTGLVGYSYEEWKLFPRTEEDLAGYSAGDPVTIADIQSGGLEGGYVINNVVATSGVTAYGAGFYVQDEGGGPWSGIYVYVYDNKAEEMGIEVGRKYNILNATVTEYYDLTEIVLYDLNDIEAVDGPPGEPTVDAVDPSAVDDWEQWEGCLISIGAAEAAGNPDSYGQTSLSGTDLKLDDTFFDYTDGVTTGATWTDVTGLVDYSYEEWKLLPRDEADLDGFGEGTGDPGGDTVTIVAIQSGDVSEGTTVTVEDVVVTAVGSSGFFVQDSGGGAWSGVYVYAGSDGMDELTLAVGDTVTFSANTAEYYDLTELLLNDGLKVTGSAAVAIDTLDPDAVSDWEQWEGCLVTLEGVEAVGAPDTYGKAELDSGLYLDDLLWYYTDEISVSSGTTWASVTGTIGYDYGVYTLNPRSTSDLVD